MASLGCTVELQINNTRAAWRVSTAPLRAVFKDLLVRTPSGQGRGVPIPRGLGDSSWELCWSLHFPNGGAAGIFFPRTVPKHCRMCPGPWALNARRAPPPGMGTGLAPHMFPNTEVGGGLGSCTRTSRRRGGLGWEDWKLRRPGDSSVELGRWGVKGLGVGTLRRHRAERWAMWGEAQEPGMEA